MDVLIPKRLYIKHDPRPFYRFVSKKALALIKPSSFSAVELCPGPNFQPMSFFSEAAGDRLSSYTAVELVKDTCRFLELYKGSKRIHIINRDMKLELRDILAGRKSYDMLLFGGVMMDTFNTVLSKLNKKIRYFLVYSPDVTFVSPILRDYDLTFFHYKGKKPSAVFASLK